MTVLGGIGCCCGDVNCSFCSDDTSGKTIQVSISGFAPAGFCADLDGTYPVSSTDNNYLHLPWLDDPPSAGTVQDATYYYNVLTLPKASGTTIDSDVCGFFFAIDEATYDPVVGDCQTCADACYVDTSGVDGRSCDPLVPDTCDDGGGFANGSTCDGMADFCDCYGINTYSCAPDCTVDGYSADPGYVPCCSCVYDAGLADWFCGCSAGTSTGTVTDGLVGGGIWLWVYRNAADEVVVYAYLYLANVATGDLQVYSGEHVFTGESSLTCLTELDGLAITLTDRIPWRPAGSGSCLSGTYAVCDTAATITLTIDIV